MKEVQSKAKKPGGKRRRWIWLSYLIISITALVLFVGEDVTSQPEAGVPAAPATPSSVNQSDKAKLLEMYGNLPLQFEANQGQTDSQVKFLSRGNGYNLFLTSTEAVLSLSRMENLEIGARDEKSIVSLSKSRARQSATANPQSTVLRMKLVGANPQSQVVGLEQLPGKVNYFIGNDPKKWRSNIPTYAKVRYQDIYPDIDLVYYGNQGQLEYDFVVGPGADPKVIELAFEGTQEMRLDGNGDLILRTTNGEVRQRAPQIYQRISGVRKQIYGKYVLRGRDRVRFEVASYDPDISLIIDPTLVYSTYLGASSIDEARGVAIDGAGNAYVTGGTGTGIFPTTPGAFDTTHNGGGGDAFVTKLNPAGSALVYSTYLGGTGSDSAFGIAIDGAGNAYVTGLSTLGNFPTTPGAFDTTYNGGSQDAFVTKLNPAGSTLVYSTYLGGSSFDAGLGLAVDGAGNAYVTGQTGSANFPTILGSFDTTFNGGSGDAFVTKLNPVGSAPLLYSTYLGGSGRDQGLGIAIDGAGSAYVTGLTDSANFPATPGAFDTTYNGGTFDAFVTKLNPAGSAPLPYSTFLGGSGSDIGFGIAIDGAGTAYVTGESGSTNFPTTPGAFDVTFNGGSGSTDAFVTKLNPAGSAPLVYSTYLGGSDSNGSDSGRGIAIDGAGSAYVTGLTGSANFPTTPGAFDTTFNGERFDAFVTKLELVGTPTTLTLAPAADTNPVGTPHTVTATVTDLGGNPVSGITVHFTVSGANSTSGSAVTDANGQASFTYTGTTTGVDTISAFADTDNDGTQDVGEPSGTATKTWTPGAPATLTLAPAADTNTVGTTHCVTATVKDAFGNPIPGVTVIFSIPTAVATQATPSSGSDVTDANGEATFCFTASLPGQDIIHAFADTNGNGQQDAGEPFGDATKTWILPPSTEFCEVHITQGGWIIANNGDQASFGGNSRVRGDGSVDGQEQYQDHGPAQPRNVHSIELTAVTCSDDRQQATIFGTATIDGSGMFVFRIDVSDLGEPGSNDSYGIILSDGYVSGQQQLQGGNVEIH